MTVELKRLTIPLTTTRQLAAVLQNPGCVECELLGLTADFSEVRGRFDRFRSTNSDASSPERARLDRELAEPLHRALTGLSRRTSTDMQFWHWLCIYEFRDIVWYRWYGRIPADFSGIISPPLAERFLGAPTLHGVSRNSFARLWWCAETLYSDEEGYDLAHAALGSQDFFQGIFEREFGLYVPAARACVRVLRDSSDAERRIATKALNHYFTTIVAEALTEDEIMRNLLARHVRQ